MPCVLPHSVRFEWLTLSSSSVKGLWPGVLWERHVCAVLQKQLHNIQVSCASCQPQSSLTYDRTSLSPHLLGWDPSKTRPVSSVFQPVHPCLLSACTAFMSQQS